MSGPEPDYKTCPKHSALWQIVLAELEAGESCSLQSTSGYDFREERFLSLESVSEFE